MPVFNIQEKVDTDLAKSVLKLEGARTDTAVFRLHYKLSPILVFVMYVGFLLIAFSNNSYIACVMSEGTSSAGSKDDVNTYCFVTSTFTVEPYEELTPEMKLMIQRQPKDLSEVSPGSGLHPITSSKDRATYHRYYFWIPFILLAQWGLFYVPRYVWYTYEGGRMKMLSEDLRGVVLDPKGRQDRKNMVAEYLFAGWGYNQVYASVFALCEVLNLVTVSVQMLFLHRISGERFGTLGIDWLQLLITGNRPEELLLRGFPASTHCVMNIVGPGGNIVNHSGICNLTLNMMTKVYFVTMWFYLSFLSTCDVGAIVFRLLSMCRPKLRQNLLHRRACLTPEKVIRELLKDAQYGDWFLLYQLAMVVDAPAFTDILVDLVKRKEDDKIRR